MLLPFRTFFGLDYFNFSSSGPFNLNLHICATDTQRNSLWELFSENRKIHLHISVEVMWFFAIKLYQRIKYSSYLFKTNANFLFPDPCQIKEVNRGNKLYQHCIVCEMRVFLSVLFWMMTQLFSVVCPVPSIDIVSLSLPPVSFFLSRVIQASFLSSTPLSLVLFGRKERE